MTTNNVSGASSFQLQGNIGKVKTTTTQNSENGTTSVNTEATKVSIFSSYDTDQSKHVSGEEMKSNNNGGYSQFKLNTDAAKKQAFAGLKGSAISIANDKVNEMKNFGAKLDTMLTKFKSSKLFAKLSPDENQTSVSQAQITTTTEQLDKQANSEFTAHVKNAQDKLSAAMAKALAEIANEAKIEGQKQDIANAAKSKDNTVTTTPQDDAVNLPESTKKDNNGETISSKDGVSTKLKKNEKVKAVKDSKDSNKPTLESLKAELGNAENLPIAGSPKGYNAKAWNNMIKSHPELNGKQIQKMITEANADVALKRYLQSSEA